MLNLKTTSSLFGTLLGIATGLLLAFYVQDRTFTKHADQSYTSQLQRLQASRSDVVNRCSQHSYKVHIFSRDPQVIYIENFLSDAEAQHVVDNNVHLLEPAVTVRGLNGTSVDKSKRDAYLTRIEPDIDPVLACLKSRAMDFQGRRASDSFESMVLQRYFAAGHMVHHTDSFRDETVASTGGNRVSTFLAYLEANCTGGGTNFKRLPKPTSRHWCKFVECEGEDADLEGVTFKPIKGNAVFWSSLRDDGREHMGTLHAGTPVRDGVKTILNIWTWRQLIRMS